MTPEILAPAGSHEALKAALQAGADAVYFGIEQHNARARAENFTAQGLPDLLADIHDRGARGYLTLNTLVFDRELDEVRTIVERAARAGVDAIIVQDLGLARLARGVAPELPIHASTQMTCTDADSVAFARELGAKRVVLARELGVEEIRTIRAATDVELEVFVHGALCVSYSGQCLTSEAIGGRSANRGSCAQACRLPYTLVVDGERRPAPERPYLLSPQDLEASALVPALVEAGVTSFKIEGRLKGPDYVAATVRLYRDALARALGGAPTRTLETRRELALQAYSRGSGSGFLGGTDHQRLVEGHSCAHRGIELGDVLATRPHRRRAGVMRDFRLRPRHALRRGDGVLLLSKTDASEIGGYVWALEDEDGEAIEACPPGASVWVWLGPDRILPSNVTDYRTFRSGSVHVQREITQEPAYRRALDMRVTGIVGGPLTIEARDERGNAVRVESSIMLCHAHSTALDRVQVEAKLGRLGDTPFELRHLACELDDAMLPPSELNRLRRALVAALLAARRPGERRIAAFDPASPPEISPPPAGLFVLARNIEQAHAALQAGADGIYLDFLELTGTGTAIRELRSRFGQSIGVCPPRIRKPGDEKIERYLERLEPDTVLVRTLGLLRQRWTGPLFIGDFSLNATNRLTAHELLAHGLAAITPAHDLDADQLLRFVGNSGVAAAMEVVVHHPMPFFHMEHCVFAAMLSQGSDFRTCGRPCERHTVDLEDRTGARHPLEADVGCRNTLFRGASQSAAACVPALKEAGVRRFRIECLRETASEVERLVTSYRALLRDELRPRTLQQELARHGLRTVRGSLQVL